MSKYSLPVVAGNATRKVAVNAELAASPVLVGLVHARTMSQSNFIATHASGTLRNAAGLPGRVVISGQSLEERTAFVFGYIWRCLTAADVREGDPLTESDTPAITAAMEWARRYIDRNPFPEDHFEYRYLEILDEHGKIAEEGLGMVCRQTSAQYLPEGKIICCLIAEWDETVGAYKQAKNPF